MTTPFLDLAGFQGLWDGPPLTPTQQNAVTLLVGVASDWIYNNGPSGSTLPSTDPAAKFVVYDVVSNAVRYQKYSKLSNYSRMTAHRTEGGSFANPMTALEFTDTHKQLLRIPLRAVPLGTFYDDDFADPTRVFPGSCVGGSTWEWDG